MKIGILTFFKNSTNYGGILQAYALTKTLNSMGKDISAEQICFEKRSVDAPSSTLAKIKKALNPAFLCRHIVANVRGLALKRDLNRYFASRNQKKPSFQIFIDRYVPHTEIVYDQTNIASVLEDVFITGSDQVWNFTFSDKVYLLDFVPNGKFKMSYAAGMRKDLLNEGQRAFFKASLSSFDAISVREESSVDILSPLADKPVQWVADPTLLLNQEEWDEVCSGRRIKERYVFCYFLGELSIKNKDIMGFASKRGLKVVVMPYAADTAKKDGDFGNYRIYDEGPSEFLSYIKYADYVFTDSFHASVFSLIYHRDFFVFNRKGQKGMSNRIESLTYLFDVKDRYCDCKQKSTLKYIESLPPIDYNRSFPRYQAMKQKSIYFLRSSLAEAEKKMKAKGTSEQGATI